MTKLSGVDWCIPQHVKDCDYDLIQHKVDVTIRDSVDGAVTRFFEAFYRDDTPSEFVLATVGPNDAVMASRVFEGCMVMKHRVKSTVDHHALLSHRIVMKYETLLVK